jgi:hypothetical protein
VGRRLGSWGLLWGNVLHCAGEEHQWRLIYERTKSSVPIRPRLARRSVHLRLPVKNPQACQHSTQNKISGCGIRLCIPSHLLDDQRLPR